MALRPLTALGIILAVRLSSVFVVQSYYVPDEYWQSLEVAHNKAFGYGLLTWEWKKSIRSYFFPAIFTALYKLLGVLSLDHPLVLIYLPRILIALLTAASDYSFYKWTGSRRWGLFFILSAWFTYFCGSRTIINTVEYALMTIALSVFPFKNQIESKWSKSWVVIACISSFIRPPAAIIWVPLAIYNIVTTKESKGKLLLATYLPIGAICLAALVALDTLFYGRLVLTPWEFVKENVINDVGSHYGTHEWYWYIGAGMLAVQGGSALAIYWAATWTIANGTPQNKLLVGLAVVYIAVHSFIPHKEYRFLLPILPLLLYVTQDFFARWSRKANRSLILLIAGALVAANALPAFYFGWFHQRGVLDAMSILREDAQNDPQHLHFLFAMPCHSTPLYSHLHVNVSTRILDCSPPAQRGQPDEAERFYKDPNAWFRAEYASKRKPTHIILFDKLVPQFQPSLAPYKLTHQLFHAHFPGGEVGNNVLIYTKEPATRSQSTQTS